jgi:hypothetical protein
MKLIRNEKGVALVMVIIIAFIGLAMVSTLLFMVTQGTRISGFQKVFRTTDEAGLGGVQIATQVIKNNLFNAKQTGNTLLPIAALLNFTLDSGDLCLKQKLTLSRGGWLTTDPAYAWPACTGVPDRVLALDADKSPDFTFDVSGVVYGQTFRVFTKIIDTVKGNTEEGGLGGKLGGSGVVSSMEGEITPPATPSLYRIEVQAQDATNPQQRSKYSVLYAN